MTLEEIIVKYWKHLKQKPNFIGIDGELRPKVKNGKVFKNILCIRIYMSKKIPLTQFEFAPSLWERFKRILRKNSHLHKKDLIPQFIERIPTDLIEIGEIRANRPVPKNPRVKYRPVIAGVSACHTDCTACIAKGSKITINSGIKFIEEIGDEDKMVSFDGTKVVSQKGIGKISKGKKEVIEIQLSNKALECTPDHKLLILQKIDNPNYKKYLELLRSIFKERNKEYLSKSLGVSPRTVYRWINGNHVPREKRWALVWKEAGEIEKGDLVLVLKERPFEGTSLPILNKRKTWKQKNSIDKTDPKFMYLIGFLLGDGSVVNPPIQVCAANVREEKKIKSIIKKLFDIDGWTSSKKEVKIDSSFLWRILKELNLAGKDAKNKRIPQWIYNLRKEEIKSLIEGLIEADGHKRKTRNRWDIQLANKPLLEDLRFLCNLVGYRVSRISGPYERESKIGNRVVKGKIWALSIYPETKRTWFKDLAKRLKIDSKYLGFERVKEIRKTGIKEVFDIICPKYHNFFANGILVHNCTSSAFFKDKLTEKVLFGLNNHCGSLENRAKIGDPWIQPSPYDGGIYPDDVVAKLHHFVEIKFNGFSCPFRNFFYRIYRFFKQEPVNRVDISFGELLEEYKVEALNIKNAFTGWRDPDMDELVQKNGRTTNYTTGKVSSLRWIGQVSYSRGVATFVDCILIEGKGFSAGGDSVAGDERLYYKENGEIKFGTLKNLVQSFQKGNELEVLSIKERSRKSFPIWSKVINAESHGIKPVIEVTFSNGKRIKITKDHSLFRHAPYKFKNKYEDRIKPSKVDKKYKRFVTVEDFQRPFTDKKLSEQDLKFFGLWLGDGWYTSNKRGVGISTGNDRFVLEFLKKFCKDHNLNLSWKAKGDRRIYSTSLVNKMHKLGFNGGSRRKRVPNFVFLLPKKKLAAFLSGYFMADGSFHTVGKDRTVIEFGSVSRELLQDVQLLLNNFGIQSCLTEGYKNKLSTNLQFKLCLFRIQSQKKFIEKIRLPRSKINPKCLKFLAKQNGSGKERALSLRRVRNLKYLGKEEVFDLAVNPSQSFVVNGILCHNSGSPVFDMNGNLVGILFAGSDTHTILCKVGNVLREGKVRLIIKEKWLNRRKRNRR